MHRIYIETHGPTTVCNAGTTGAAGVRYFENREGVPFSAAMLAFARHPRPQLLFIDQVVLDGSLGQYSIRRQTFGSSAAQLPLPLPAGAVVPPVPAASRPAP